MISKAQRIVDNLTDLGRETMAEDLSKRILECKSGTILREQDPCLMQFEDVKGHIELIRGAWAVTPWNIQLKLAEANSLHHMMVVNGLVKKHAEKEKPLEDWPEDASQELQAAIEQLVPILKEQVQCGNPHVPRRPCFLCPHLQHHDAARAAGRKELRPA